ncbi:MULTISPECIES: LPS translocon maturation chaperone LptM [Psychrobacter]|uniref:LPS translocon maturation chaperone LptM n=1 Tax=Psychrobacter TaxID=497 RepID=UPI0018679385|nr:MULTISPECIES: lipoprotein [Psychrobacter]
MFTINRFSKTEHANVAGLGHRVISTFIISGVVMMGLTGCGQKGNLYLTDASNQMVQGATDSAGILGSSRSTQDDSHQGMDEFKLPEPSEDPNDY